MRIWNTILLFVLIGCQKQTDVLRTVNNQYSYNGNTILTGDTTLNTVWDGKGNILRSNNFKVKGKGTLVNWIIDAPYTVQVFDTTITLSNIEVYGEAFSAAWYGASSLLADNYSSLQKSIDVSKNNFPLYIPTGIYKYSKSLKAATIYKGVYTATFLNMYGDGDMHNSSTSLVYTGVSGFAFGIQYAKGGSIHNLHFQGQFIAPSNNGMPYYNLSQAQFNDVSGKCSLGYSGIVIDYDGTLNTGGSTALKIYDTWVTGFDVLYNISPNAVTYNADDIEFTRVRGGDGRICFLSNEGQEKGNVINFVESWGNLHTLFNCGNSGKFQAGSWTINGGNIAGSNIRLFNVRLSGWNAFAVNGLTAEGIATIGTITSGDSYYAPRATLNDLRIRFAIQANAGIQTLFTANWTSVSIQNSTLWYYGRPQDILHFSGKATMINNNYSNPNIVWQ